MSDEKDNPFLAWIDMARHLDISKKVIYLPNHKVVKNILEKSSIELSGFEEADDYPQYPSLVKAFLILWSSPSDQDFDSKKQSVSFDKVSYKITSSATRGKITVRYINAWIGTPSLGIYLSRILRGNDGADDNFKNPFNEFQTHGTFLPDITYLSSLYKELGVKNFDDIRISGTGDWDRIWKGIKFESSDNHPVQFSFGETEKISVLWENYELKTFYLERLPKVIIERLKFTIAQNREMVAPNEWEKDPLQAVAERNLKGKDLISLCNTSREINAKCNANDQQLFKVRLMEEFEVNWNENNHGFAAPRELYRQMHTFFEYVIITSGTVINQGMIYPHQKPYERSHGTRMVALIPRREMFGGAKPLDSDNVYIIAFPNAPQFTFYFTSRDEVFETSGIEKRLSKQEILSLARGLIKIFTLKNHHSLKNAEQSLEPNEKAILDKLAPEKKYQRTIISYSLAPVYFSKH